MLLSYNEAGTLSLAFGKAAPEGDRALADINTGPSTLVLMVSTDESCQPPPLSAISRPNGRQEAKEAQDKGRWEWGCKWDRVLQAGWI